jgi:hypothetical protein
MITGYDHRISAFKSGDFQLKPVAEIIDLDQQIFSMAIRCMFVFISSEYIFNHLSFVITNLKKK